MRGKRTKIQNRSVEYSQFKTLRMISFLLYGVFGSVLIASMWFLYTNMYQTIGQVETISALSPAFGVQVLQVDKFDMINKMLSERDAQTFEQVTRDPFNTPEAFAVYIQSITPAVVPTSTTSTIAVTSTTSIE